MVIVEHSDFQIIWLRLIIKIFSFEICNRDQTWPHGRNEGDEELVVKEFLCQFDETNLIVCLSQLERKHTLSLKM